MSGIYGGLYDANEGHLDVYGTTHAYVAAARRPKGVYITS
jgi:dimethylglycine dehydrogenase